MEEMKRILYKPIKKRQKSGAHFFSLVIRFNLSWVLGCLESYRTHMFFASDGSHTGGSPIAGSGVRIFSAVSQFAA